MGREQTVADRDQPKAVETHVQHNLNYLTGVHWLTHLQEEPPVIDDVTKQINTSVLMKEPKVLLP